MRITSLIAAAVLTVMAGVATAAVSFTIDGAAMWNGYMNVLDLGGVFQWGSGWGVADLCAVYSDGGATVTCSPNNINDIAAYWYTIVPGATNGNKIMEGNVYAEPATGLYNGATIVFAGSVTSFTLSNSHTLVAFIKDFAPDYSSFVDQSVAITSTGNFSINLATINDPTRHVQWGLQIKGVDVWITDAAPFGNAVIKAIPEPATMMLAGIGVIGMLAARRK
ncbi:MAG: PEP-CTERM sorting domain-containing protein [bacterium]|nr:PEP-CTERM sorting domain-containing protein [bacterium]